jgi:hypothetical protein
LVFDSKTKTIVSVDGIQFSGRIVTQDDTFDDGKRGIDPEPISLTPEILRKAGFKKEEKLNVNAQTWYKFGMGEYLTYYIDGFCQFEFGIKPAITKSFLLNNFGRT